LSLEFGLACGSAAASGLHYAHEQRSAEGKPLQIVHRDVSPSNVIVTYDGNVKLIDFGIAKAAGRTTKTATGFVKGKSGYMAPEQILGYEVDRRTDVFALGVLVYELTTQQRAFGGNSEHEATHRIVHGAIVPPSQLVPGYPVELEEVVMTALELDPDDRFQDAAAMQRALEQVARELHLNLGTGSLTRVLDELFGTRREPWIGSLPASLVRHAPLAIAPVPTTPFARGSAMYDTFHGEVSTPDETVDGDASSAATTHRIVKPVPEEPECETVPILLPEPAEIVPASEAAPATENAPARKAVSVTDIASIAIRPTVSMPTVLGVPRRTAIACVSAALACGVGIAIVLAGRNTPTAEATPQRQPAPTAMAASRAVAKTTPKPSPAPKPAQTTEAPAAAPAPSPAPSPAAAPAPSPAPTAQPDGEQVKLHVTSDPTGATVVLDGVRLGTTPFDGSVELKHAQGWLKVRKKHYKAIKIQVSLDHDVAWEATLPPLASDPP
jgi:serine/threonine-protein kinase